MISNLVREAKTRFYQTFASKPQRIQLDKAIISFSFDDAPKSAFENGLPILDKHAIKATFYIAAGLTGGDYTEHDKEGNQISFLSNTDIKTLDHEGHHIGCHTYSHYMLNQGTAEQMECDAAKNIQTLKELIGEKPVEHFSYPFGQVSFKAKQLLGKHYKTMRSSRPGINTTDTDLYLLRAISIYHSKFSKPTMQNIINDTLNKGGWLVFYTHGVDDNPGDYDCTAEQLDWVINQSVKSGAHILPIVDAYNLITQRSE
ncbi:MAG: polysaccharide deacetylase family protein [Candidatus Thiodiazotropha sp.]|jgi:peptidoglycan/xylan/chitin deacetylase (PgdA/CDA1 family)